MLYCCIYMSRPQQKYIKKKSYRGFFFKYRFISEFNDIIHYTPTHQFTRSSNWGENRPFSFDSHVATIEHRKVVMQPTYCRHGTELFLIQKSTISILLDFNYLAAISRNSKIFQILSIVGQVLQYQQSLVRRLDKESVKTLFKSQKN